MKFTGVLLACVTGLTSAAILQPRACGDNCARQVLATRDGAASPEQRSADCSRAVTNVVTVTATPTTTVSTVYSTVTSTGSATTSSTGTSSTTKTSTSTTTTGTTSATSTTTTLTTSVTGISTSTVTVVVTSTITSFTAVSTTTTTTTGSSSTTIVQKRALTTNVPAYASACTDPGQYASACSCLGVTPSTSTLTVTSTGAASGTTVRSVATITITATATIPVTATNIALSSTVVTVTSTSYVTTVIASTATSFFSSTSTTSTSSTTKTTTTSSFTTTSTSSTTRVSTSTSCGLPGRALATPTPIAGAADCSSTQSYDDDVFSVTLPFNISVYTVSDSKVYVHTNGFLFLQDPTTSFSATQSYVNYPLYSTQLPKYAVAPYWDDLYISAGTGQGIYYQINGTAPARLVTFEWYVGLEASKSTLSRFIVQFNETAPAAARFRYFRVDDTGSSATVGIQDGSTKYIQYEYNTAGSINPGLILQYNPTPNSFTTN